MIFQIFMISYDNDGAFYFSLITPTIIDLITLSGDM